MKRLAPVLTLFAVLLMLVLTVRAQDETDQPATPTPTPQIVARNLTIGFYGDPDSRAAQGMQLAIEQIDAEGGFVGGDGLFYRFEARFSDNPADLANALAVLVLPPIEESDAPEELVFWNMPVIMLSPDTPLGLRGVQATVFRGMTMPIHQADALIDFLVNQSIVRRLMLIGEDATFEYVTNGVEAAGQVQVQRRESALLTADEFQTLLEYDPHLILYDADVDSAANLVTSLHERAWAGFFLYTDPPALLDEVDPEDLDGIVVLGVDTWVDSVDDELGVAFVQAFDAAYNRSPDAAAVAAYDLTWAMRLMVGRVGPDRNTLVTSLPVTALIRTTAGQIDPARYGPSELYRNVTIFEYLPEGGTRVLARYDGGQLIGVSEDFVAFATATPLPTATPGFFVFTVTGNDVNVRSGPSRDYASLGQLSSGQQLEVLGQMADDDDWLLVKSPWGPAWIVTEFGTLHDPGIASLPIVLPPAPPTATPTTRPPTPPPPPPPGSSNQSSAVNNAAFELGGHVANQENPDLVRSAGMTWIKEQVRWERGETPANGARPAIEAARRSGLKILISSVGWNYEMGNLDAYMDEYAAYLGQVAAVGPDAIEVWNEPNIDREWVAGRIDGATYTRLLQKAYTAIKAANPNVMVVSAALAPTGFFGGTCTANGCDDDVFLRQMVSAGAANYLDCVGVHYNEGIVGPTQRSGDPRGDHHSRYFPAMLDVYHGAYNGSKPLCFTELGYLTPDGFGNLPPGFEWASGTSISEHAEWLGRAVSLSRADARVRFLMVWNVNFGGFGEDPRAGYAILRPDGSCPACGTLAAAMR